MTGGFPRSVARPTRLLVGALMVLAVPLGGCATAKNGSNFSYSDDRDPDEQLAIAGERSPTAKTLYAMAKILAAQRREQAHGFVLRRIIREYPRFMLAYCDLAQLQLRHRRVDAATATLLAGLDLSPGDPVLLNNLGMCRLMDGDYQEALSMFTQAASANPQDARHRANMAVALGMLERYEEALAAYRLVISEADAHYNLGVLCEARQDSARASQEYRQAEALGLTLADQDEDRPLALDQSGVP